MAGPAGGILPPHTEIRREYGLETARVILGHRSAAVTEVYAELDVSKAREVMRDIG